jgi:hypothetical protein
LGTGEGAVTRSPTRDQEDTKVVEDGWWAPGPGDLLIEGEEGEYFLELLMREASPEKPNPVSSEINQPAREKEDSRGKTAPTKGKGKKKGKKKALKGGDEAATRPEGEKTGAQKEGKSIVSQSGKQGEATPPDPLSNPEARGMGLVGISQTVTRPGTRPTTTSRGECSGQEKPDSWSGEGMGNWLRKGRSVYE